MSATIISGFPGVGKTYFHLARNFRTLDSDSSAFSWSAPGIRNPEWPANYLDHIKKERQTADFILVSSHREVRIELETEGLLFHLVYPAKTCKLEYLRRYKSREDSSDFIALMDKNFNKFVEECERQSNCIHWQLPYRGCNSIANLVDDGWIK